MVTSNQNQLIYFCGRRGLEEPCLLAASSLGRAEQGCRLRIVQYCLFSTADPRIPLEKDRRPLSHRI